jgi:hypothetical protein
MNTIKLTKGQVAGFHAITTYRRNVFLSGPSGAGKTELVKLVCEYFRQQGKRVCKLSSTRKGAAAIGGQTVHAWFDLGELPQSLEQFLHMLDRQDYCHKHRKVSSKKLFSSIVPTYSVRQYVKKESIFEEAKKIDVLVISDVNTLLLYLFDHIEVALRIGRESTDPFGGVQVILEGDFCQLSPPPPEKPNWPGTTTTNYAFESANWKLCIHYVIELTEIVRQSDPEYAAIIPRMRKGVTTISDVTFLHQRCLRPVFNKHMIHLFATRYQVRNHNESVMTQCLSGPMVSLPRVWESQLWDSSNLEVDPIVDKKLLQRYGLPEKYFSKVILPQINDKIRTKTENEYLTCYFDDQIKTPLQIKQGCRIKIISNKIDGLFSGSFGTVQNWFTTVNDGLKVNILFDNGKNIAIETEQAILFHPNYKFIRFSRFPFTLAFAATINEMRGMTLQEAAITIDDKIFLGGSAYVALSCVATLNGLYLTGPIVREKIFPPEKVLEFYKTAIQPSSMQMERWSNLEYKSMFSSIKNNAELSIYNFNNNNNNNNNELKLDNSNNNNNNSNNNSNNKTTIVTSFLKRTGNIRKFDYIGEETVKEQPKKQKVIDEEVLKLIQEQLQEEEDNV